VILLYQPAWQGDNIKITVKQGVRVWAGFIWLRFGSRERGTEFSGSIKRWTNFDQLSAHQIFKNYAPVELDYEATNYI
jgi:hypothetical protein